jgi:hypothetical protein
VPSSGRKNADHCAECGELVIYNATPDDPPELRLVCTVCLTSGPNEVDHTGLDDWHPNSNPMHCSACFFRLRR